jgi:hypothetical protein
VGIVGPAQLRVTATNVRGASRTQIVTFVIDDTPPLVEIITPEPGALVGGIITVEASVEDPAGIDETSVRAIFSNGPTSGPTVAEFDLFPVGGGVFRGTYDSREIRTYVEAMFPGTTLVFPTLTVRARDSVGNEGQVGEIVVMDYTPPLASLDPPRLREAAEDRLHGGIECTAEFDPLGDDATNDGQSVAQISEYRARIEDRANTALSTSDVVFYRAGVNGATAEIVFLDNTTEVAGENGDALLVDTNGDGVCDDVNPLLREPYASSPNAILGVNLEGITPTGEQYKDALEPHPYPGYPICDPPEEIAIPPVRLCPPTGLQRVIEGPFGGSEQVIFTIGPTTDLSCVGFPIDLTTNGFTDGWFCAAVRVEDNLGNVGISQPIRVCLDHDGNGAEGCPGMPSYPSSADEQGYTCVDPLDPATCSDTDPAPIIPTQNPGIDCTGTFTPPAAGSGGAGTVDSADDCTMPDADFEFPSFEIRREDLDE